MEGAFSPVIDLKGMTEDLELAKALHAAAEAKVVNASENRKGGINSPEWSAADSAFHPARDEYESIIMRIVVKFLERARFSPVGEDVLGDDYDLVIEDLYEVAAVQQEYYGIVNLLDTPVDYSWYDAGR